MLEKALNPTVFPKLVEATFKNVKTSLELGKAMSLASDVTSMPKENIRFYQEVGTPAYFNGLWYYLLDADKTTALMSKIMNNETITDEDINPSQEFENSALAKGNSENYNSGNSSYKEYNYTHTKKRKKVEDTKLEETPIFNEQNNQNKNKNKVDDVIINNNTGEQQNQNNQNKDSQTNTDGNTQNQDGTTTENQGQNQQNQDNKQNQNNQNTGTSGENSQNKDNSNKDNSNKDNTTKTPATNEGGNSNQNPTTPSQPETPTTPPKEGGEGGEGDAPIF